MKPGEGEEVKQTQKGFQRNEEIRKNKGLEPNNT
jgi:hypothetical protein